MVSQYKSQIKQVLQSLNGDQTALHIIYRHELETKARRNHISVLSLFYLVLSGIFIARLLNFQLMHKICKYFCESMETGVVTHISKS